MLSSTFSLATVFSTGPGSQESAVLALLSYCDCTSMVKSKDPTSQSFLYPLSVPLYPTSPPQDDTFDTLHAPAFDWQAAVVAAVVSQCSRPKASTSARLSWLRRAVALAEASVPTRARAERCLPSTPWLIELALQVCCICLACLFSVGPVYLFSLPLGSSDPNPVPNTPHPPQASHAHDETAGEALPAMWTMLESTPESVADLGQELRLNALQGALSVCDILRPHALSPPLSVLLPTSPAHHLRRHQYTHRLTQGTAALADGITYQDDHGDDNDYGAYDDEEDNKYSKTIDINENIDDRGSRSSSSSSRSRISGSCRKGGLALAKALVLRLCSGYVCMCRPTIFHLLSTHSYSVRSIFIICLSACLSLTISSYLSAQDMTHNRRTGTAYGVTLKNCVLFFSAHWLNPGRHLCFCVRCSAKPMCPLCVLLCACASTPTAIP